jgi:hypothetical protein
MSRPSKPMAKNSNSKFVTRNDKREIFSKIVKASNQRSLIKKQTTELNNKDSADKPK